MLKRRTRKLRKVGDSTTISIPPDMTKHLGWELGDDVQLDIVGDSIQLKILRNNEDKIKVLLNREKTSK